MTRNLFSIFVILFLFLSGAFCAGNAMTAEWWNKATLDDVKKRFDSYTNLDHFDVKGRSVLVYALMYSNDPKIPMYLLKKPLFIFMTDKDGRTIIDYARSNPVMKEPLKLLERQRDKEFALIGRDND